MQDSFVTGGGGIESFLENSQYILHSIVGWNYRNFKQRLSNTPSLAFRKGYQFQVWEMWNVKILSFLSLFFFTCKKNTYLGCMTSITEHAYFNTSLFSPLSIFHYLFRNKQRLSNEPGWNQPKNKLHWGWSKKSVY